MYKTLMLTLVILAQPGGCRRKLIRRRLQRILPEPRPFKDACRVRTVTTSSLLIVERSISLQAIHLSSARM